MVESLLPSFICTFPRTCGATASTVFGKLLAISLASSSVSRLLPLCPVGDGVAAVPAFADPVAACRVTALIRMRLVPGQIES